VICRCRWSEFLAVAELVTTHVVEVFVGIIFVQELLTLVHDQLSVCCQINLNSNTSKLLASITFLGWR
jgi:hypothetical protein